MSVARQREADLDFVFTVEAFEEITVPAGAFKTFRIWRTSPNDRYVVRYELKLGLGMKRDWERYPTHPWGAGTDQMELVSHTVTSGWRPGRCSGTPETHETKYLPRAVIGKPSRRIVGTRTDGIRPTVDPKEETPKMIRKTLVSAAALVLSLAAAQSAMAAMNPNGTQLNGYAHNGYAHNGLSTNGTLNGLNSGLSTAGSAAGARIIAVELPTAE